MYHAIIAIRAAGLPACAGITHFAYQPRFPGSPYQCASDWDCLGYEELEWDLLDRKGRLAPWLARKLSPAEHAAITRHLLALAAAARAGGER
jgi:hypothetical protein